MRAVLIHERRYSFDWVQKSVTRLVFEEAWMGAMHWVAGLAIRPQSEKEAPAELASNQGYQVKVRTGAPDHGKAHGTAGELDRRFAHSSMAHPRTAAYPQFRFSSSGLSLHAYLVRGASADHHWASLVVPIRSRYFVSAMTVEEKLSSKTGNLRHWDGNTLSI